MGAPPPRANESSMGKKSTKQSRRRAKKAQIADLHKSKGVSSADTSKAPRVPPSGAVAATTTSMWALYIVFAAAAAIGTYYDAVARVVPDEVSSRWCKFLFVIITCINVRSHARLGSKPWYVRAVVYFLCNFAGATTICIARAEVPAYVRAAQPWINVGLAASLVEMLMQSSRGRDYCMYLRTLCVVPVSLWKTKTLGRIVLECYVDDTPLVKTLPMVTADMWASGLMMLVLAHLDGAPLPTARLAQMAQHVVAIGLVALAWKLLDASGSHNAAARVASAVVLDYNLVKFCWPAADYYFIAPVVAARKRV
ncbi:Aste57867_17761 [Aphanomyces stellatus]|uniref:Aste57867_17761 protein n=1 Tax=Aphanomyces stellatus TaxID=120398 RepID=A0A485L929_9STRA|nr:hypothetical protein As57867_017700 [Aphanomyces stellatus]VFT94507.1 Aste57867_17761 [Aphanomyces stellatus]